MAGIVGWVGGEEMLRTYVWLLGVRLLKTHGAVRPINVRLRWQYLGDINVRS